MHPKMHKNCGVSAQIDLGKSISCNFCSAGLSFRPSYATLPCLCTTLGTHLRPCNAPSGSNSFGKKWRNKSLSPLCWSADSMVCQSVIQASPPPKCLKHHCRAPRVQLAQVRTMGGCHVAFLLAVLVASSSAASGKHTRTTMLTGVVLRVT